MTYALSAIAIMVAIITEIRANAVRPYNELTGNLFHGKETSRILYVVLFTG